MSSNFYGCFRDEIAAAKIVLKLLNFKQKQRGKHVALEMLKTLKDDSDMLNKVITGDESLH